MIAISPPSIVYSDDDIAKQNAAKKQMSDLLQRVSNGEIHRTLTAADRTLLENEGFAPDLVNNLVYKTQRFAGGTLSEHTDKLVTGYTDAAIDPSIYASPENTHTLEVNNQGNCAFCDSHLSATDSGEVFHFRPAAILQQGNVITRSPYNGLAYDINNLHFACKGCCEHHKQSRFPVSGERYPAIPIADEKPMLLNPYSDQPADFICYSPLTGEAYPLDLLQDFFVDFKGMTKNDVKSYLLANPQALPEFPNEAHTSVEAETETQKAFINWLSKVDPAQYRGYQTIQLFGLNRESLLYRRFAALARQYIDFTAGKTAQEAMEYRATCSDALNTWQEDAKKAVDQRVDWNAIYAMNPYSRVSKSVKNNIPDWMKSRLFYFVRESELTVSGKRRVVYLGADDFIYGSDNPEKSVFLSIDWQEDIKNPVKVRNKKFTWDTSFTELANSHSLEISKLFANNELWAEGDYEPLA